ncbi:hypothetical protein [Stenomitos frigidus]|uniref:Uncharacterized protein n=1 Tax=Stenomitos frigidus ULC18 TaxID=2107698 RepID=A0A2T1E053_9CYAN|nr:hypothetical protein [Stenomitos frigidus]PSB25994.1 hypothetical protein C7B82_21060 [Stenomitos frigidus ULC18]
MNQRQQNLRYAAARAFIESLDQLQETLQPADEVVSPMAPEHNNPSSTNASVEDQFDLNSLEQAVADIEQFIQKRQEDGEERGA